MYLLHPQTKYYHLKKPLRLESGEAIEQVTIAYQTYGKLNEHKDNVIWVCHAFSANADVENWWPNTVGDGLLLDTSRYFIVCANILGSCYGTTGTDSINPATGKIYGTDFPQITVRDMVSCLDILRCQLEIRKIFMIIGGSIGAQQALEWTVLVPDLFINAVLCVAGARTLPWAIAFNEAQRMAIEADPTFKLNIPQGGANGMRAARAVALISYRSYQAFNTTQKDDDDNKQHQFKVQSYQRYQGEKLVKRFSAYSYYRLSEAIDSHNVGRNRGGIEMALKKIKAKVLCIGIDSDILFPVEEVKAMATFIPNAIYKTIHSAFGHDGFLIETETLTQIIRETFTMKQ